MISLPSLLFLPAIWIVDAQLGPGAHFADLPAAVAAAATGDTIVLRAGDYSALDLSGKALTIRGEGAAVTRILSNGVAARVANTSGVVVISGVYLEGSTAMSTSSTAVELIECELVGRVGPISGGAGLSVGSSTLVLASRCTFVGGSVVAAAASFGLLIGGDAVRVATSGGLGTGFVADRCILRGGNIQVQIPGLGMAGRAILCSGRARLDGSRCRGGDGSTFGTGGTAVEAVGGGEVRIAGDATTYVIAGNSGSAPARAIRAAQATVILHGSVSTVGSFDGTVLGAPELPRLRVGGVPLADGAFDAQQQVQVTLDGLVPNGLGFLAFGTPVFVPPQPPFESELMVGGVGSAVMVVPLDAAGRVQLAYTPAALGPAMVDVPIHLQGGVVDPTMSSVLTSSLDVHIAR